MTAMASAWLVRPAGTPLGKMPVLSLPGRTGGGSFCTDFDGFSAEICARLWKTPRNNAAIWGLFGPPRSRQTVIMASRVSWSELEASEPWKVFEAEDSAFVVAVSTAAGHEGSTVIAELGRVSRRHARLVSAAPELERALRLAIGALEESGSLAAVRAARRALRIVDGRSRGLSWRLGSEIIEGRRTRGPAPGGKNAAADSGGEALSPTLARLATRKARLMRWASGRPGGPPARPTAPPPDLGVHLL